MTIQPTSKQTNIMPGWTFNSSLSALSRRSLLVVLLIFPTISDGFTNVLPPRRHASLEASRQRAPVLLSSSATTSTENGQDLGNLPLPPMKNGFLQRFRDLFAYLKDPDDVIKKRFAELGPIFRMYLFFKPIVVVGGEKLVEEFTSDVEYRAKIVYPEVPDIFLELHTEWGSLNMDIYNPIFPQSRKLFAEVLSTTEARAAHTKVIEPAVDEYVEKLVQRVKENPDQEFFLGPELKSVCLQTFSKIFSGKGLTSEQEQAMMDYNAALIAISRSSEVYKKGAAALENMAEENLRRFHELDDVEDLDVPGKFYHSKISGREGWEDEDRIGKGIVLFVWGAYSEVAGLMMDALVLMAIHGTTDKKGTNFMREKVVEEFTHRKSGDLSQKDWEFWCNMKYTTGVLREKLRLEPPGGSVPRFGNEDFALGGYRIPAKTAVQLDPRYGNNDPNLFVEPQKFEPLRWVKAQDDASTSKCPFTGTATNLGKGAWFPGSYGAHQCPGVPLAEVASAMFVAKMAERFEWELSGSGLKKDGSIDYVTLPVRMIPDSLGLKLRLLVD